MAEMKFVYFPARAKGEFCRLVLMASGHKFQDVQIDYTEGWTAEKKAESPFGQLPYLEYNGKKYAQSVAIGTFLARQFGMYGKTNLDALRIDEVVQLAEDIRYPPIRDWIFEKDETKKAEMEQQFKDKLFPKYLGFFECLLQDNGGTGFFVGNAVTLADLSVYDILDTVVGIDHDAITSYTSVLKLRSNVEAVPAIKSYLHSRPKSPF